MCRSVRRRFRLIGQEMMPKVNTTLHTYLHTYYIVASAPSVQITPICFKYECMTCFCFLSRLTQNLLAPSLITMGTRMLNKT